SKLILYKSCEICLEKIDSNYLFYINNCKHIACNTCLYQYLDINLKNISKYPIKCFSFKCKVVISYDIVKRVLNNEDKYFTFKIFNNIFNTHPNDRINCPYKNCNNIMIRNTGKYIIQASKKILKQCKL